MKIVYRAANIIEAHIVAGMLEAEGIGSYVGGHYLQGAVGDLSPLNFANVFVDDDDLEPAERIISDYDREQDSDAEDSRLSSGTIDPLNP